MNDHKEKKTTIVEIPQISNLANRKEVSKKRQAKYREILKHSIEIIQEHGLGSLTLQAVADKMNLQRPALYRYFISVRELWIAVQIDFKNEINNRMQELINHHEGSYEELVFDLFMFYYNWITDDLARYLILHDLDHGYAPGANKLGPIEKGYRPFDFILFFRYAIEKGIENNEFKKGIDISQWIFTLWSIIDGFIHSAVYFIVEPDNFSNPYYRVSDMSWVKVLKTRKKLFPNITRKNLHDYVRNRIKEAIDQIKT